MSSVLDAKKALRLIRKLERRARRASDPDRILAELAEARRALRNGRHEWAELLIRDAREELRWSNA